MFTINKLTEVPKEYYKKILLFNIHCDLGDNIICNGMLNYYLNNQFDYAIIPIYEKYRDSLEHLYDTNRCVLVNEEEINDMLFYNEYPYFSGNNILFLGNKMFLDKRVLPVKYREIHKQFWEYNIPFDQAFYKQGNVPYEESYTRFKIFKRDYIQEYKLLEQYKDYDVFLHDDGSRAFLIKDEYKTKKYIFPSENITTNIFNWIPVIQKCKEIHCIDSCFLNLIDRIDINEDVKLYYHAYAKDWPRPSLKKKWIIIE